MGRKEKHIEPIDANFKDIVEKAIKTSSPFKKAQRMITHNTIKSKKDKNNV